MRPIAPLPYCLALASLATGCQTMTASDTPPETDPMRWATPEERALSARLDELDDDWRCGAVVYHVFVDRFAPAADLDAKRHLYPAPKTLMSWDDQPKRGTKLSEYGVWSHEIEFWGGDLDSLRSRLDHIETLGADVVYLNPIHEAWTNHKYDALDYAAVSPEYGDRADVAALAADLHGRGMRLMLDGVFNHMGRNAPIFREAMADPGSPYRKWFDIDEKYPHGYRAWYDSPNLPEIHLEDPDVRALVWGDHDSIVRGYLREGVDGWRLDVAYDYGLVYLAELTAAAHQTKEDAWVVGEVWNYPEKWVGPLDGVMNFYARQVILRLLKGELPARRAGRILDNMVRETGLEGCLRSWIVLDNHDAPRLASIFPEAWQRDIAQTLQFTLPGSPVVYYGVEAGMVGGDDPANRGPMDWDNAVPGNPEYDRVKALIDLRASNRALRVGDFVLLDTGELLAFQRRSDRVAETTTVVVNPTAKAITEVIELRDSKLMNYAPLRDELSGAEMKAVSGLLEITVPARTVMVLRPTQPEADRYSPYKRMH